MSKIYNAAIVGFGGQGHWHSFLLNKSDRINCIGAYDIRVERNEVAANEYNLHVYNDYEDMLNDEKVDIIIVATPNDVHHDLVVDALKAGKNVICEKPVAMNSIELEDMIKTAKECGKLLMVNQNRRWDEDFLIMKEIYQSADLGPVHRIERRVHGAHGIPGDWRQYPEYGGGMMLDWGVHLLDQMLQMIPEKLKKVYCTLSYVTNERCDDGITVISTFESGLVYVVEVGTSNFIPLPSWYMLGRDGTAIIRGWGAQDGEIVKSTGPDGEVVPVLTANGITKTMAPRRDDTIEHKPLPTVDKCHGVFYKNVADVLDGTAEQAISNESVLRVMRLMEAAFKSAKLNEAVDFE